MSLSGFKIYGSSSRFVIIKPHLDDVNRDSSGLLYNFIIPKQINQINANKLYLLCMLISFSKQKYSLKKCVQILMYELVSNIVFRDHMCYTTTSLHPSNHNSNLVSARSDPRFPRKRPVSYTHLTLPTNHPV